MMVGMAGFDLPIWIIRRQIASAINIVVQVSRLTGGLRKVVKISEITGMEGDIDQHARRVRIRADGLDDKRVARGTFWPPGSGLMPGQIGGSAGAASCRDVREADSERAVDLLGRIGVIDHALLCNRMAFGAGFLIVFGVNFSRSGVAIGNGSASGSKRNCGCIRKGQARSSPDSGNFTSGSRGDGDQPRPDRRGAASPHSSMNPGADQAAASSWAYAGDRRPPRGGVVRHLGPPRRPSMDRHRGRGR